MPRRHPARFGTQEGFTGIRLPDQSRRRKELAGLRLCGICIERLSVAGFTGSKLLCAFCLGRGISEMAAMQSATPRSAWQAQAAEPDQSGRKVYRDPDTGALIDEERANAWRT
jgi:hypothetical protein